GPHRRHRPEPHLRRAAQGRRAAEPAPPPRGGARRARGDLLRRAGRDGGLHRPERRGEVHDHQDAHRHPGAHRGPAHRGGRGAEPAPHRARAAHRRGVRAAHDAVVGPAAARLLRAAPEDLRHRAGPLPREPRRVRDAARARRPARHPGAPALAGPADARRHHRGAAARPRGALPRRADDRPRRRQQGPAAGVPAHPQRRARHHAAAHHARPPGHRGPVRPGDRHRPRHAGLRRHPGRPARARRLHAHAGRGPGRRGTGDLGAGGQRAPGRGSAAVAQLPGRRQRRTRRGRRRRVVRRGGPVDPGARHRGRDPGAVLAVV
ncbi:MAG: Efflux ABC transporter, ATP-binding protein, partial [uncultured Nocardioides sp.]